MGREKKEEAEGEDEPRSIEGLLEKCSC